MPQVEYVHSAKRHAPVTGASSPFCWVSQEDISLYSLSYHHHGSPKTWYGVPGSQADLLETVAKKLLDKRYTSRLDSGRKKRIMLQKVCCLRLERGGGGLFVKRRPVFTF